ncbi:PAS domain-containing protein [Haloarcula onubensis]|uniref:PAS domain-containing protein n=1 Tax=Haloarcula onubensis TaxID=2950539 RepID=A0ABU2FNY6_9EURY|nr:PAS domain-containing protein [Halomicroarcula sp. S3CR25-11]MDS0282477.1 PAS domain-containing protein [Halomicroarcula sp. S3CR25-11]
MPYRATMHSDTDSRTHGPAPGECVLLGDGEGTVVWSDPAVADVLGRKATAVSGRTVDALLGPAAPDPPPRGTTPITRTLAVPTDDGEVRDISVTVDAVEAPGAATVYRCRRTVDEQLDVYHVLSRVEDAVVAFDTEWRYTYVNETAERLLDRSSAELLGEVVWEQFPKTVGTDIEHEFRRALATQEPSTFENYSDSLDRWVEIRVFPSPTGASVYFRDISARKAREAQLQRERDLTEQLLRVSPMGIAVHTPDGRFVRVNERAEEIIGIDREELLDTVLDEPIWDARGPDGEPFPDEAFPLNVVLRTGEPTFGTEMSVRRRDGARFWISVGAAPVLNEAGDIEHVVVSFEEITERKQREADLQRERDLTEQLLRVSPMGIAVHTPDGRFVRVNQRAGEILGVEPSELVGEVLVEPEWESYGPDGEPFPDEAFPLNVVLRTGEPTFGTEMTIRRRDGTQIWLSVSAAPLLDADGDIERVVVGFEEITERKRYEQRLRKSERQFRAVFEGTLDALLLADDDGTYVDVNRAACDLYGLDEDELVGRNVAEFAPPDYDVAAAWDAFLETGTLQGEFPLVRPDGETRVTDFVATANVTPGLHLSALRDITERKADEVQLAAQRDELARLNDINALIRGVHRTVVGATDRETVERAVCEGLVASESYPVALTTRFTGEPTEVEHAAGLPDDALATLRAAGATRLETAIDRTATADTVTVLSEVRDDASHPALRDLAADRGVRTLAAIPIESDGVVYGVLTVGSTDADAFTGRERAVFAELGRLLGTAIESLQTKRLLYATGFLELELALSAEVEPVAALNDRVGGRWRLDGVVPVEAGRYLLYVDVGDAPLDELERAADGVTGLTGLRRVDTGDTPLFELRVDHDTPVSGLLDAGGRIRDGTIEHGDSRFVVDVTLDTDVRGYLDRLEQRGIEVELLAKREVERTAPAARAAGTTDTALTTRQRTVLEAAYLSGYFDWPRRRTTGEELADALDIATSTLHQHLRVASAKVFEQYFDGTEAGSV